MLAYRPQKLPAGGTEMTGLRDYTTGDDPKRVDWNICARHDELRTREYGGTAVRYAYLLVDGSNAVSVGKKTLEAIRTSAVMLAYGLLYGGAVVRVGTFARTLSLFPPVMGRQRAGRIAKALAQTAPKDEATDFSAVVTAFLNRNVPVGDVYLVSDFFGAAETFAGGYSEGLLQLHRKGYRVHLIHLIVPENRADGKTGDVMITDNRGYRMAITLTERDLHAYQKLYDGYLEGVKKYSTDHGLRYTRVWANAPEETLCLAALGLPAGSARVNPWAEYITKKTS